MKVEIWSDIACPWCYVGKRRFEQALERFARRDELEITWRSFELDPSAPRDTHEAQTELLARKYGVPLDRAQAMNERMAAEGAKEGLEMRFDAVRVTNTFDAHRLIHFAARHGKRDAMVERLFHAYFTDGATLGNADTLAQLAGDVGLNADDARAALANDPSLAEEVRADEERAREFGISGVPFFAIDERYGISGAQPADVLLEALTQALDESLSTNPAS